MQTEGLLVRHLAKLNIDQGTVDEIERILSPDMNWAYFFEQARSEGVAPLVYSSLSRIDHVNSSIPEEIRRMFESCYYTAGVHNTLLCQKLNGILNSLNQAGIEVILLKGMSLIHTIYPNIALRPMYDIDILIHKKDFSMVENKLKELGYNNSVFYPEDFHKDKIMVDVHEELMNITRVKSRKKSYCINTDDIWKTSVPIEISGYKASILSPEYCLIELCLHLILHHGLQGLMWFVDIAELIEHYKNKMDWDMFIEKSIEYKICKPVYCVLFYVKMILGQDVPQFVLDELKPRRQNFLEKKIFNLIVSGAHMENIRFFFTFLMMERFSDRLTFLREISLPSPKVLSARYKLSSNKDIPGYYLIHFKDVFSSSFRLLKNIFYTH